MSTDLLSEQAEIVNEFLLESREMLDHLEPTIIELGQSCQLVDCWLTKECTNDACHRHGRSVDMPCWLHTGFIEGGDQSCLHASSAEECRSCSVFQSINGHGETMNAIFRLFHSMKGSAGFLELNHIAHVAHAAESLLDLIRAGKIQMIPEHVQYLCQSCDFAREAMDYVEQELNDQGMEEAANYISELLAKAAQDALQNIRSAEFGGEDGAEQEVDSPASEDAGDLDDLMQMLISPEMLERFVQEADELLQNVEQSLLAWSDDNLDAEGIAELYRNVHSFKGNSGFFSFSHMEKLTHQMESLLDVAKEGREFPNGSPAEALLGCLDALRGAVADVSQEGGKGNIEGLDGYLKQLALYVPNEDEDTSSSAAPGDGTAVARSAEDLLRESVPPSISAVPADEEAPEETEQVSGSVRSSRLLGEILIEEGLASEDEIDEVIEEQRKPLGELLVARGKVQPEQLAKALEIQKGGSPVKQASESQAAVKAKAKQPAMNRQDIRVDLGKLDDLINLIGEMVIAENMLLRSPDIEGLELDNFNKAAQQMSKLVRDLQEMAMVIRMIPVSGLFRRMIRLVHDLSVKSGKKVDLQLFGQETEVDKTVIEQITDPLVHLLRNSLDHGLETPSERIACGKAEKGVVKLSARHQEGEVWIEVEDDGRGLNRDKILSKAISKGLVAGDGSHLSEKEIFNLIFQPGFSTADKVTDVSGRGVGMDVVKKNLEKIKGKIEVQSSLGQGSRITLRIPLTLAIIDGMLVRIGESRCIVPLLSIREIFRPTREDITVMPDGLELARVRDSFHPIIYLDRLLEEPADYNAIEDGVLIVVEYQDKYLCLLVDEILGQQQTVIKGLSDYIGNVRIASGCTILGNGEVCLILDVATLVEEHVGQRHLQAQ
jgi:two-component system chemotaxis sensor kinase CheA